MVGNPEIVAALNTLLPLEKTAHLTYWQQSRIAKNLGYGKFAEKMKDESEEELGHAKKIADRVLLLDGVPSLAGGTAEPGTSIAEFLDVALKLEQGVHAKYVPVLALSLRLADPVTQHLLEHIQKDTEGHIRWLETQIGLSQEMGLANYLTLWV